MSGPDARPNLDRPKPVLRAVPDPPRIALAGQQPEPLWRELAGAALKDRRQRQGRTLRQVATRAGLSPQYLSEIERGRKEPSSEMLASLCGALGLTLADLLTAISPRLSPVSSHRPTARPTGILLMAA